MNLSNANSASLSSFHASPLVSLENTPDCVQTASNSVNRFGVHFLCRVGKLGHTCMDKNKVSAEKGWLLSA